METDTNTDSIVLSFTFKKEDLICCVCQESLTKQIYQCTKGNHYVCGVCEPKLPKTECPTCRHPGKLIRNSLFEQQLREYLTPCTNVGCTEKFFKWDSGHKCLFAPVKCRVCKREVGGGVESYCNHLEGFCDCIFQTVNVPAFEKRLKLKLGRESLLVKLPDKIVIVIKKTGHDYKLSAIKNPDNLLEAYKNIICTYTKEGIEYSVTIPITNADEIRVANIQFKENEVESCVFSKDIQAKQKHPVQLPTYTGLGTQRQNDLPFTSFGRSPQPIPTYPGTGVTQDMVNFLRTMNLNI